MLIVLDYVSDEWVKKIFANESSLYLCSRQTLRAYNVSLEKDPIHVTVLVIALLPSVSLVEIKAQFG